MVPYHSFDIYGTWEGKESCHMGVQAAKVGGGGGGQFLWGRFSHLETMLLLQKYWGLSTNAIYS